MPWWRGSKVVHEAMDERSPEQKVKDKRNLPYLLE